MLLFFLPGRERMRAMLGLGMVCALTFLLGCGGGSGGGGGGGGGGGPVATTTGIKVTSVTKGANGTFAFTVTVTGGTPSGQVQLFDGATSIGAAVTVANGTATFPAVSVATVGGTTVGTHGISAHYGGDANTLASQSGALNVTVTGTASVTIATNPASTNAPTVQLTVN